MISATTADGVSWLDQKALWEGIAGTPQRDRLVSILFLCGVRFHDGDMRYAREPAVLLRTMGGLGVSLAGGAPKVAGLDVAAFVDGMRETMGHAAMDTYLNPKDRSAAELYGTNVDAHGIPSVAHTVHLGFFVAGLSQKAELEFCSQRDLVHLSRLTSARTGAQDDPPILVEDERMLDLYADVRRAVSMHADVRGLDREIGNSAWPLAKCSILGISGTLKNLLKTAAMADDEGKEAEVRRICASMRRQIHVLFPELEPTA